MLGGASGSRRGVHRLCVGPCRRGVRVRHADPLTKAARSTWARLIKKVYEVDPLICPHCGGQMRFLAVIEEPPLVRH